MHQHFEQFKKLQKIKLIIGDPSGDGHRYSEDYIIISNLTKEEIRKAEIEADNKLGMRFSNLCCDHEDMYISEAYMNLLINKGIVNSVELKNYCGEPDTTYGYLIDHEFFVQMYLGWIEYGNPEFRGAIIPDQEIPSICIGGYGLFYT